MSKSRHLILFGGKKTLADAARKIKDRTVTEECSNGRPLLGAGRKKSRNNKDKRREIKTPRETQAGDGLRK